MPFPWEIIASGVSGAAVTLLGVVTGGVLTSRTQRRQWARDKQITACTAIISESTRAQLALRRSLKQGDHVAWAPWNEALAVLWVVGTPKTIEAARSMDKAFWRYSSVIKDGKMSDDKGWAQARDEMESVRLTFINAVRVDVANPDQRITMLPVARPPLPERFEKNSSGTFIDE